jgi:secondary thiamine-phosphate synthase enzyme
MKVITETLSVTTKGHCDVVDLTGELRRVLKGSGLSSGTATLFVSGSTAGISTIEFEPGAAKDLARILEKIAPEGGHWDHHATWGDDNGAAHCRACLLGPSLTVPFTDGRPLLGTWQQVVLLDFDTRGRSRSVVVQMLGE